MSGYVKLKEDVKIVRRLGSDGSYKNTLISSEGSWDIDDGHFRFFSACDGSTRLAELADRIPDGLRNGDRAGLSDSLSRFVEATESPSDINGHQVVEVRDALSTPCTWAIWEITRTCNATCKHCYQAERGVRELESDVFYTGEQLERSMANLSRLGVQEIKITGGEITTAPRDRLLALFDLCRDYAVHFRVNTNGLNELSDFAEVASKNPFFRGIQVSLDGYGRTHDEFRGVPGMFDKIKGNIAKLGSSVPVQVVTMLHGALDRENAETLTEYVVGMADSWLIETPAMLGNWKTNAGLAASSDGGLAAYEALIRGIVRRNPEFAFTVARIFDPGLVGGNGSGVFETCGHHHDMINISPAGISFCVPFKQAFPSMTSICQPYDDFGRVLEAWKAIAEARAVPNAHCSGCDLRAICQGGCPGQYVTLPGGRKCDLSFKRKALGLIRIITNLAGDPVFVRSIEGTANGEVFRKTLALIGRRG